VRDVKDKISNSSPHLGFQRSRFFGRLLLEDSGDLKLRRLNFAAGVKMLIGTDGKALTAVNFCFTFPIVDLSQKPLGGSVICTWSSHDFSHWKGSCDVNSGMFRMVLDGLKDARSWAAGIHERRAT
jgi:hypothetical protein